MTSASTDLCGAFQDAIERHRFHRDPVFHNLAWITFEQEFLFRGDASDHRKGFGVRPIDVLVK